MRDMNTVFLEVMRKDDPTKLKHYADVAGKKFEDAAINPEKRGFKHFDRKQDQFFRLTGKSVSLDMKKKAEDKAANIAKWKGRAKIGAGVAAGAGLAYGAYRWNKNRQQQKAQESMRDTNTVFLEVMRKDNPKLLNRLHDLATARNNHYDHIRAGLASMRDDGPAEAREGLRAGVNFAQREMDRKFDQAARMRSRLRKHGEANPSFWNDQNLRRAKWGVGLATVGAGVYGAYRLHKRNQQQKVKESTSQYFARMLREAETRINANHVALGLDVLKATGFDQAVARQMGDDKQRSQAWKYAKRGAALGLSLPALQYGIGTAYELGMHALDARRNGVGGVGDILRYARDHRFGAVGYPSATMQAAHELGRAYMSNPALLGKASAGLAGAGALYGLMKKAPSDKKPAITMMKPKKQYKYIRKDGEKYVYPKKIGVKK